MKILVKTFGCPTSHFKTGELAKKLSLYPVELVFDDPQLKSTFDAEAVRAADVCVINTCAIFDYVESAICEYIRSTKAQNPKLTVIVMGCGAAYKHSKVSGLDDVDFSGYDADAALAFLEKKFTLGPKKGAGRAADNKVMIKEGCSNFCTYCMVPYGRGAARFVPFDAVAVRIREVERDGFASVQLVSVCMSAWRDPAKGLDFADLLNWILANTRLRISGLELHPRDFSGKLLGAFSDPRVSREMYIPFQSASDRILSLMGRGHGREELELMFNALYSRVPGLKVSTDVMIGFPGEKEADFDETLAFLRRYPFGVANLQKYCRRKGTPAYDRPQVPDSVKDRRYRRLIAELNGRETMVIEVRDNDKMQALVKYGENVLNNVFMLSQKLEHKKPVDEYIARNSVFNFEFTELNFEDMKENLSVFLRILDEKNIRYSFLKPFPPCVLPAASQNVAQGTLALGERKIINNNFVCGAGLRPEFMKFLKNSPYVPSGCKKCGVFTAGRCAGLRNTGYVVASRDLVQKLGKEKYAVMRRSYANGLLMHGGLCRCDCTFCYEKSLPVKERFFKPAGCLLTLEEISHFLHYLPGRINSLCYNRFLASEDFFAYPDSLELLKLIWGLVHVPGREACVVETNGMGLTDELIGFVARSGIRLSLSVISADNAVRRKVMGYGAQQDVRALLAKLDKRGVTYDALFLALGSLIRSGDLEKSAEYLERRSRCEKIVVTRPVAVNSMPPAVKKDLCVTREDLVRLGDRLKKKGLKRAFLYDYSADERNVLSLTRGAVGSALHRFVNCGEPFGNRYMKFFHVFLSGLSLYMPGRPKLILNTAPVDYLIRTMIKDLKLRGITNTAVKSGVYGMESLYAPALLCSDLIRAAGRGPAGRIVVLPRNIFDADLFDSSMVNVNELARTLKNDILLVNVL